MSQNRRCQALSWHTMLIWNLRFYKIRKEINITLTSYCYRANWYTEVVQMTFQGDRILPLPIKSFRQCHSKMELLVKDFKLPHSKTIHSYNEKPLFNDKVNFDKISCVIEREASPFHFQSIITEHNGITSVKISTVA